MNKRQAQRLLRVALSLRQSPNPNVFSMELYVHDKFSVSDVLNLDYNENGDAIDSNGKVVAEAAFCGTPACALGHYGARNHLQPVMRIGETETYDEKRPALLYRNNRCVDFIDQKIQNHFGIDEEQSEELFGCDGCGGARTPIEAARYIEKFVKRHYGPVTL